MPQSFWNPEIGISINKQPAAAHKFRLVLIEEISSTSEFLLCMLDEKRGVIIEHLEANSMSEQYYAPKIPSQLHPSVLATLFGLFIKKSFQEPITLCVNEIHLPNGFQIEDNKE